jgi:acyl carrier protein
MTQQEKIDLLEEAFEEDPGTLDPETLLDSIHWDSMAMLTVIALVKEHFDKPLSRAQIKAFRTVGDILTFME